MVSSFRFLIKSEILFLPIDSEGEALEYLYFAKCYGISKVWTSVNEENYQFIVKNVYRGDGDCSDLKEYDLILFRDGNMKIENEKTVKGRAFCD